jgi:hypothetical protein
LGDCVYCYTYDSLKVLENNLAHLCFDRGICTNKIVPCHCLGITLFEKTNEIVYLIDVSISNSDNLRTADTKKRMRKVAELSIEVKQQWLEEEMYT